MSVKVLERDMSAAELERMRAGFDEYEADLGLSPILQVRHGIVAVDGDRFIGCSSGLTHHRWFYLTDLWIDKPYRKQGLGRALLQRLEAKVVAENVGYVYTWTASHQAPAFYQKLGYAVFCELKDYYRDGHSRIGLRKKVTSCPEGEESRFL